MTETTHEEIPIPQTSSQKEPPSSTRESGTYKTCKQTNDKDTQVQAIKIAQKLWGEFLADAKLQNIQ
jgi:hypothetical protein